MLLNAFSTSGTPITSRIFFFAGWFVWTKIEIIVLIRELQVKDYTRSGKGKSFDGRKKKPSKSKSLYVQSITIISNLGPSFIFSINGYF